MRAESTVALVEGECDWRAVIAAARRLKIDLAAVGADVVAMHGVTNLRRHLAELDARPAPPRILGLFDIGEQDHVARMLAETGREAAGPVRDLEALDFFACALDLEDELIRAAGPDIVEGVLADHLDLLRFLTFQRQPA